jgi:hypothetical protein
MNKEAVHKQNHVIEVGSFKGFNCGVKLRPLGCTFLSRYRNQFPVGLKILFNSRATSIHVFSSVVLHAKHFESAPCSEFTETIRSADPQLRGKRVPIFRL